MSRLLTTRADREYDEQVRRIREKSGHIPLSELTVDDLIGIFAAQGMFPWAPPIHELQRIEQSLDELISSRITA